MQFLFLVLRPLIFLILSVVLYDIVRYWNQMNLGIVWNQNLYYNDFL